MVADRSLRRTRRKVGAGAAYAGVAGGVSLLAAACGMQGTAPGAPAPGGAGAPARAAATVQVWEHRLFKWREDVGKEITDPLLAANPWLTLDVVPAANDRTKFLASAAGGTPPDVYSGGTIYAQEDFLLGATISLERYLAGSRVLKKADLWEGLRRGVEFKGHATAVPYAPDVRITFTHVENAHRAGLDPEKPPARWADLEVAAQKAFRGGAGAVEHLGWFPFLGSAGSAMWLVPYWQLGGELLSADGTKFTLFNDRAVEALTWLKKIVDNQGGWAAIDAFRNTFADRNGYTVFIGGGTTYYVETLSERGEQFNIKAPTMRIAVATFPLPDRGGRAASLGGCHALPVARGSKSPDAAWLFVEHVTNPESNVKFAARFDRVPIRESSCASPAYLQGDKGRAVQCQEMKARKFWLEVPGGGELVPFQDPSTPFMTGQMSVQDALKDRERQGQEVLDKWLERARTVTP